MKTIKVHQVDAFTDTIFGGNPAGVVTNADVLTDEEMQKVAREMNLSETAFVLGSTSDQADVKLRFFTPSSEIQFCGHATVGALFSLARLDLFGLGKPGKAAVRVETNAGILPMAVVNDGAPKITFAAPEVDLQPYRLQGGAFAKEFGVPAALVDAQGTIHHDKNLNYVYIPVTSLRALGEQTFDYAGIRKRFGAEGIVVFCLYTDETVEARADLHARGLAPNVGVDEDPFTGSMQAGLMLSAKQNGCIASETQEIITEQGHFIGRPGSAMVQQDPAGGQISVVAGAAQVFSTEMEL